MTQIHILKEKIENDEPVDDTLKQFVELLYYELLYYKRLTIDIPADLHKRFRKASIDLEKHMKDIMLEYIESFVDEHEKGQDKEEKGP